MADEHGPDAPDLGGETARAWIDLSKPNLNERIIAAIDDAFIDGVKVRFNAITANEYGEGLGTALAQFKKGLGDLKEVREKSVIIVKEVFG